MHVTKTFYGAVTVTEDEILIVDETTKLIQVPLHPASYVYSDITDEPEVKIRKAARFSSLISHKAARNKEIRKEQRVIRNHREWHCRSKYRTWKIKMKAAA